MFALLPLLSLLVGVSAQDSAATDIAVVEARFEAAQLVPQFLPSFSPEGTLDVTFGGQAITTGETLEQSAVSSAPELSITPAEDATRFADTALYTVIMADADVPGTDLANTPQTRHWLVNTVSVAAEGEGPYPLNFTGSTAITDYAGPGPAEGSGPHRYVVLVYSQPGAFTPPADLSQAGTPLGTFQVQEYVNSTGLGALVAANYFTVENGQATSSIPATTSVDPATVSAAESTSTASVITSGMPSQTSGGSSTMRSMTSGASASASSGAATSSPNAANKVSLGMGMITGVVGVVGSILGAAIAL